jgi:hypothetical protein
MNSVAHLTSMDEVAGGCVRLYAANWHRSTRAGWAGLYTGSRAAERKDRVNQIIDLSYKYGFI